MRGTEVPRGLRSAENDLQARNPHETKSHEWTEFLVTRNQRKHPDRECAKASHDGRISGRGEIDWASPPKNVRKTLYVIRPGIHSQYLPLAVRRLPAVRRSVTAQA